MAEDANVFLYNIEADAIFTRGMDWGTHAITARLDNGDSRSDVDNCQKVRFLKEGDNRLIHLVDRETNRNLGQDDNDNAGAMWSDMWTDTGDRSRFSFAASPNYPNAYVFTNVAKNRPLDVLWGRGGKLTLFDGKGYTDWAAISEADIAAGKLPQFKARKAIWGIYQALVKANAVEANAAALEAANSVYNNAEATTDQLRAAFRTLFLAVAGSIEDPVDVSYMFTHADIFGDQSGEGWGYNDFPKGVTECEMYHAAFTLEQALTDAPNGLYDVTFVGIYRQDGGDTTPPALTVTASAGGTGNLANMENLGAQWAVGGGDQSGNNRGEAGWANSSTGKRPNWMFSAGPAQALDDACAKVENVKVKDNNLTVKFQVVGGEQWVNFQRFIITYKGSINAGLYKSLVAKIAEASAYSKDVPQKYLDAISTAVNTASSLSANSEEEDLTNAISAIEAAIAAAEVAPLNSSLNALAATIALANAEGIDVAAAQNVYENATNEDELAEPLYNLRAARKLKAAQQHKIDITKIQGSEPANGEFYLVNVGTGLLLNTTTHWGCHIDIDNPGMLVTLVQDGTGNDELAAFHMSGNGWNGLNWTEEYWDKNGEHKSVFRPVAGKERVYYWNVFDNFEWHFVYDVTDGATDGGLFFWNAVQKRQKATSEYENDLNAQWMLVTADELKNTYLAQATEENPLDATVFIKNPGFDRNGNTDFADGWTNPGNVVSRGGGGRDNQDGRYTMEFYQSDANLTQTLTGLRPGKYQVSVNGFYRDGNTPVEVAKVKNGEELNHTAKLVASTANANVEAVLPNMTSEAGNYPGLGQAQADLDGKEVPTECYQAEEYFAAGLYKATTPTIVVGGKGELTIGITNTYNEVAGSWVLFDNFRLTYLGPKEIESMAIVGDFTEIGWDPAAGLEMTQDAENPAIWTATKDVTVEDKKYEYKVTANDVWGEYELPLDGNQDWVFGTAEYPAGDYRLVFTADTENHTLTLAVYGKQSLTLDENATEQIDAYEYADVTVNRAFNEGWNAVVLPFDTEAFNDAKIVELDNETVDGEGNVTLKFKKAESIKANVPYLVNFPAAVPSDKVFYGVNVAPAEAKVEGEYFDFVGTHVKATVVSEGDYVISGGKLSKATTDIELKGGRTFFKAKTQAGVRSVTLSFDDDVTTGISVISNATVQKSIYNLQGQKVNKASKGIFIENGKKVIK